MATETASALTTLNALSALPIIHSTDTYPTSHTRNTNTNTNTPILPRMPNAYRRPKPTATSTSTPSKPRTITVSIKPLRPIPTLPAGTSIDLTVPADTSIYDVKVLLARRTGYAVGKVKVLYEKRPVGDGRTVGEVAGITSAGGNGGGIGSGNGGEVLELEPGRAQVLEMSAMFTGAPTEMPEGEKEDSAGSSSSKANAEAGGLKTADAASLDAARKADVGRAGGVEGGPGAAGTRDVEMAEGGAVGVPVAQGKSGSDVLETEEFWEDLKGFLVQRSRDERVAEVLVGRCREGWRGWVGR